jgi:thiol-disulfide isomerase/thioredoxin
VIRAYDTTGPEAFVHPLLDKKSFVSVTREREGDYTQDLVVIKFYAPWCRACRGLEPKYKRLAMEYSTKRVVFYEMSHKANESRHFLAVLAKLNYFVRSSKNGRIGMPGEP